jgi:aldehyde:ferredoxin oxidoreductase
MLDEYYAERGWDKNGTPTAAKLKELGIKKR